MRKAALKREALAIALTALFCGFGFLAIWIAKSKLGITQEVVYIAFLLLPILIYLIVVGRVLEFKVFGTEAKFASVATQSIEPVSETIEPSVQDTQVVAKEGIKELQKRARHLDRSKPIILTLVLGKAAYYEHRALEQYVEVLSQYPSFRGVMIVNEEGKFQVCFPSGAVVRILKSPDGNEFVQDINQGQIDKLPRYPGALTKTLTKNSTNLEALQEMTTQNLDALIVVNEEGKLIGVVERNQLISKLLLAMAQ